MENKIQTFTNAEFGIMSILIIEDEPWFIGKEIAEKLGYLNTKDTIKRLVDAADKRVALRSEFPTLENAPNRGLTIINESGLYSLIMHSKLKSAKKFQRWVTAEVLPSIRKHGAYMTPETIERTLHDPDFIIDLAQRLKDEQAKNAKLSAENKALVGEISSWDWKACVSALVRTFAVLRLKGNFQHAWNVFYKNFNYTLGTNIRNRKNTSGRLIDYIREEEQVEAVRIAAAMCSRANVDVGEILNTENLRRYEVMA